MIFLFLSQQKIDMLIHEHSHALRKTLQKYRYGSEINAPASPSALRLWKNNETAFQLVFISDCFPTAVVT